MKSSIFIRNKLSISFSGKAEWAHYHKGTFWSFSLVTDIQHSNVNVGVAGFREMQPCAPQFSVIPFFCSMLWSLSITCPFTWLNCRISDEWFIGVFSKWNRNSLNLANSANLINHWSMNWAQFKDPASHLCLAGAVVASWSLTQDVAGSSPFTVMTNIFVTEFSEFIEII